MTRDVTKMSPHVHSYPQLAVADFAAYVLKLLSYGLLWDYVQC